MEKNGKRYFTQKELEKHINKRLIRERKKYDELEMLRKMMDELIDSGSIDADSYAEAAERLGKILATSADGNMRTNGKNRSCGEYAEECKNSIEATAEDDDLNVGKVDEKATDAENAEDTALDVSSLEDTELSPTTAAVFEAAKSAKEGADNMAQTIENAVQGEDLNTDKSFDSEDVGEEETDVKDEKADITETLAKMCTLLLELVNGEKKQSDDDGIRIAKRELCSTGFSSGSASDIHSMADGLTPMQRELAKRAGLSYREYAQILSEIPKNVGKRKHQVQAK